MATRRVQVSKKREQIQEEEEEENVATTATTKTKSQKLAKRLQITQRYLTQAGRSFGEYGARLVFLNKSNTGPKFAEETQCPFCGISTAMSAVRLAAIRNRYDHDHECSGCRASFAPVSAVKFTVILPQETVEFIEPFVWLCRMQTRDQFAEWLEHSELDRGSYEHVEILKRLAEERPEIYWNALYYVYEESDNDDDDRWIGWERPLRKFLM